MWYPPISPWPHWLKEPERASHYCTELKFHKQPLTLWKFNVYKWDVKQCWKQLELFTTILAPINIILNITILWYVTSPVVLGLVWVSSLCHVYVHHRTGDTQCRRSQNWWALAPMHTIMLKFTWNQDTYCILPLIPWDPNFKTRSLYWTYSG